MRTYCVKVKICTSQELCYVDMSSSSGNFSGSCGHMCNEKMSRLQSALQLANESERIALEMAEEARQMAKKALEEEAKANENERKA